MTQEQKDALVALAQYFAPQARDSDRGDDQEDQFEQNIEEDGPAKKRKRSGTGSRKPRHPWGVFMRLKDLKLPLEVEKHLHKKSDAVAFLGDDKILAHKIGQFGGEAVADAFVACYRYTLCLETRISTDHFRWCFTMLMYFDLVQLIRPNGSGKVGAVMLQEIEAVLGPVLEQIGVDTDKAIQRIDQWSLYGAKLHQLCEEFGPGCLFFLGDFLSVNL